jgi:imidazolonepropionase-like amidohydrolase
MKNFLFFILFHFTAQLLYGQAKPVNLFFPAASFQDSTQYKEGISLLADKLITVYKNVDKAAYYNDLFRLHFARADYAATLQALDSFAAIAIPDKKYTNAYGLHYRTHSMAMLDKSGKDYRTVYTKLFNSLYLPLPDDGKDQVNNIFEKANPDKEKAEFLQLIKKHTAAGDSITETDGINFVKQWNFWQVYSKTAVPGNQLIAAYKEYEIANRENKLLGLDEGSPVPDTAVTYITNVTLVDVEKEKLLPNSTIAITGKTITAINPGPGFKFITGAGFIDGKGQYLIPGLTDAHIHFFQSGGLYTRPDGLDLRKYMPYEKEMEWNRLNMKDVLKRNVMNGITTVIDVGATYNFLKLRDQYKGKTFAPSIFMTGPLLTTNEPEAFKGLGNNAPFSLVTTEEEGRKMVQAQLPYRPDFIKIWYILEQEKDKEQSARTYLPIIKAIIDESHKSKLKVAVHATESITAQLAAESGCDYLVHSVDDEMITDAFAKLLKEKNITLCPTLTVFGNYAKVFGQQLDFSAYEYKNANPVQLGSLEDIKHLPGQSMFNNYKTATRNAKAIYDRQDSICLVNLKKLADAGVRIAAGTDAGNIGTMHGTSLITELMTMKKSGISNWQVLQSVTINPAYILNKEKQSGSIAVGKMADMVLLKSNPLDDLQNLRQISLVINKGQVIKPDTLIKETALALVQRQLNAYNARNLEAFLEPYADDVELYQYPNTLISKGKEAMRKGYAFFNTVPDLHCEIKERIIQGNIIIDKESVTGFGSKPAEAVAIYHIEGDKIKKVYFIK